MFERPKSNEMAWKDLMDIWVKSPGIRQQYLRMIIKKTWTEQMGQLVTKYTERITLQKGILTIQVSSTPLRQELMMSKAKIIALMNEAMGETLVQDIRVL